ncbi:hypothetical protein SprV_0602120200 [Sparganum proliferum]
MASAGVFRCVYTLLTCLLLRAASEEKPCVWSSRTIRADASTINITVPANGQCRRLLTNKDFFSVRDNTFVGMKSGNKFPFLPEKLGDIPALRILIEDATEVDYIYLFCEHNGAAHVITIARSDYTERINALNHSVTEELRKSFNETETADVERMRSTEMNLNILTAFQNMPLINEDFCNRSGNVYMKWTFPRAKNEKYELTCTSSKGPLCATPKAAEDVDICYVEEKEYLLTYTHTARPSDEEVEVYNCVLNGDTIVTKIVHWSGEETHF